MCELYLKDKREEVDDAVEEVDAAAGIVVEKGIAFAVHHQED